MDSPQKKQLMVGAAEEFAHVPRINCKSGVWTKGTLNASKTAMYLRAQGGSSDPAPCPTGWEQIDFQYSRETVGMSNMVRTCLTSSFQSVIYLKAQGNQDPASCPDSWFQADYKTVREGDISNSLRTCYH